MLTAALDMTSAPAFSTRELFGGALTIDLPAGLLDASDIRQVPDTQEVFLSRDSDISYIIEILESVEADTCEGTARLHFDALAHDNSALSSSISSITVPDSAPPSSSPSSSVSPSSEPTLYSTLPPSPPNPPTLVALRGTQQVQKFGRGPSDEVSIFMAIWRVTGKGQDVVFTINCPDATRLSWVDEVFARASRSFAVVDFGLFADA